jgi:hypothetical protein
MTKYCNTSSYIVTTQKRSRRIDVSKEITNPKIKLIQERRKYDGKGIYMCVPSVHNSHELFLPERRLVIEGGRQLRATPGKE